MVVTNTKTGEFTSLKELPKEWDNFLYDPPIHHFLRNTTLSLGFHTKEERDSFDTFLKERENGLTIIGDENIDKEGKIEVLQFMHVHYLLYNIYEGQSDITMLKEIENKKTSEN